MPFHLAKWIPHLPFPGGACFHSAVQNARGRGLRSFCSSFTLVYCDKITLTQKQLRGERIPPVYNSMLEWVLEWKTQWQELESDSHLTPRQASAEVTACTFPCTKLDFSTLIQFQIRCRGSDASHTGLGLSMSMNLIKTIIRDMPRLTQNKHILIKTLDSRLYQVDT